MTPAPPPSQVLSAKPASIALAALATSRPPLPWRRVQRNRQRSAVDVLTPARVRVYLTGKRTRRFPDAIRPVRRDGRSVIALPTERLRRNHAETHRDAGSGPAM